MALAEGFRRLSAEVKKALCLERVLTRRATIKEFPRLVIFRVDEEKAWGCTASMSCVATVIAQ